MTEDQMHEAACFNVQANLILPDDVAEEADAVFDGAYILAFDKLASLGCSIGKCRRIAASVARLFVSHNA